MIYPHGSIDFEAGSKIYFEFAGMDLSSISGTRRHNPETKVLEKFCTCQYRCNGGRWVNSAMYARHAKDATALRTSSPSNYRASQCSSER